VFLLVHRAELVKQVCMTLARFGVEHSVIAPAAIVRQCMAGEFRELGRSYVNAQAGVFVCSVQTLVRRLDNMKAPDLIICDEAHHGTDGSTWGKIIAAYPEAKCLLVTATPCRLDGKGLGVNAGGFADDIIVAQSMRWLIDNGYLSEYRYFEPPMQVALAGVKMRYGDYAKNDLNKAVDKPTVTGDAVDHYLRLARGKRAVAFCVSVAHAEHVAEKFNAAGVPASTLDGSLDPGEREKRIAAFAAGDILLLASCDVVSEGFDLPAIEAAILLRPTQSLSLYLQQVGRALRTYPGKEFAIILDHVGNRQRHGLPDDDREWTLEGVTRRASINDGAGVSIKTCAACFAIYKPAPACPYCGSAAQKKQRELQEQAGNLVELTPEARKGIRARLEEQKRLEQRQKKREERDCRTLEDFIALGESRGYKFPRQWAEKRFGFRSGKGLH
jgi:superfamily II DNA or RNA helicase